MTFVMNPFRVFSQKYVGEFDDVYSQTLSNMERLESQLEPFYEAIVGNNRRVSIEDMYTEISESYENILGNYKTMRTCIKRMPKLDRIHRIGIMRDNELHLRMKDLNSQMIAISARAEHAGLETKEFPHYPTIY